jgi:DNA-binding response OmpR family regulator
VFECIRGGAEDYLLKPVTRKEVQHMWQHVWRRQQQQSALRVPHFCTEEVLPQPKHPLTLSVTGGKLLKPDPRGCLLRKASGSD